MQDIRFKMLRKYIVSISIAILIPCFFAATAWAVPEVRKIDTSNVTKFEEARELKTSEESAESREEEKKAIEEGEAAETGEALESEHEPWWMFPGWQTVFAVLGVGFSVLTAKFLPKIMAKEEGQN